MESEVPQIKAATFGMFCAVQAAIRAIVTTHPDIDALLIALKAEGEESFSSLLATKAPDESLDAFRDTWNGMVPFPDGGPESKDPRI